MKRTHTPSALRGSQRRRAFSALCGTALMVGLGLTQARAEADGAATTPAPKEEDAIMMNDVVVTTIRGSLMSADEFKTNAPVFVDSIVAQDIGKLPDNTVADALQRVAGIQVAHGAGEANTPVIRGLPNIETTINGYEVFTGTSRGVAFQDIPAEMVAGLDAYKSVNAEQIEGGVAGVIDVRLRRPFDFKLGLSSAMNVRGMYSDQAKKDSYFLSGLVNRHWKNENGEFGVLVDISYQRRQYQDQIFDNWVHYGYTFDVAYNSAGVGGYYGDNFGYQVINGDRTRPAAEVALQWKTKGGVELYSETLFTGYNNTHSVNFFIGIPSWGGSRSNVVLYPSGYDGYNVTDPQAVNGTGTNARFVHSFTATGTNTIVSTQALHDSTSTIQGAAGAKWKLDDIKFNSELSYNISTYKTQGEILDTITTSATETFNITYNDGSNPSVSSSGLDFTNGSNFYLDQLFDQWSRSYSGQYALKTDAVIPFKNDYFHSLKAGVRFSDRDVHYHQANAGAYAAPWFGVNASALPGLGKVQTNGLFVSNNDFSIRNWWSPDPQYLLSHTDAVRTAIGRPTGRPAVDPASTFMDNEKNEAFYAQLNYGSSKGAMPFDGIFGARLAHTDQTLHGYVHPLDSTGTTIDTVFLPGTNKNSRWDFLPSLNGRLHLTDKLLARASVTRTITRPNFGDLNPALSLQHSGPTSQVGSGSGGNPNLQPIKSVNYDLGLEYYFNKSSHVTAAGFYRDLNGYVQSFSKLESVGGTNYNITRPQNTGKGSLKGFELSYQQFFDFLPEAFKGFGFQANFTDIDGHTEDPSHPGTQERITQVAKTNYNLILIYEKGPMSFRLADTWRGKYIDSYNQPGFQPTTVYVQPYQQVDFSASYDISKNLTLTFDITNLTRSKYRDRFGDLPMFNRDVRSYDRTFALGARMTF